tara:strand:- start:34 stop:309 length:276 start_codon:yes stop_codon:yes gene_type:complete
MTTLWFLMVLVTTPYAPTVGYQGFAAYHTKEICESLKVQVENYVSSVEEQRGRTSYVQSYCMEVQAFDETIQNKKEGENINFQDMLDDLNA